VDTHTRLSFLIHATPLLLALSLHDALPILHPQIRVLEPGEAGRLAVLNGRAGAHGDRGSAVAGTGQCLVTRGDRVTHIGRHRRRSEEHTSELQSPYDLVCRLLLEKKKRHMR